MKFTLLSIGKTKQDFVISGIDFYLKRLSKYCKFENVEIPLPSKGISGPPSEVVKKEGQMLQSYLKGNEFIILLDEKGHQFSSEKFSQFIQHLMNTEPRNIVFVIGGAYGFSDEFRKLASTKISLSAMTFPHQLIRLIFCEQFYRAMTIQRNEPYHHI